MPPVNRNLKQHSRKVYSRQMIEHVVEQIDTLYWEAGVLPTSNEEDADADADPEEESLIPCQTDDLTLDSNIAKLPTIWPSAAQQSSNIDQDDYLASVSRLQELSAQRQTMQNRLTTYQTLLELLEPYDNPRENIQPNIVWKDAPLAPELAKTRTLAIRVAGRIEEHFANVQVVASVDEELEDVTMDGLRDERRNKVDRVLASW